MRRRLNAEHDVVAVVVNHEPPDPRQQLLEATPGVVKGQWLSQFNASYVAGASHVNLLSNICSDDQG